MDAIVIPSIRKDSIIEFLNAWDYMDLVFLIVEDNPQRTFCGLNVHGHYDWQSIEANVGDKAWIFSHRDSAIRSFGYYMAYQLGAERIFTLDDDCMPIEGINFVQEHIEKLNHSERWESSVPGFCTRGMPYKNRGKLNNVVLSVGLWEGVPDLDAVHTLIGPNEIKLPDYNRIIGKGVYFPMCGMNLCFKREIAPLMYFPLMGEGQPYRRFDDIWCGVIAKKVCDHLGLLISVGKPHIHHAKASNVFTNLAKEAPGIGANEQFWETIDNIHLTEKTPIGCMMEIGQSLEAKDDAYLTNLGRAITVWASLFEV